MSRQLRFRTRLTLLATAMAAVLSVLFAWASIYITEDYEHVLVDAILHSLAEDYAESAAPDAAAALPRTRRIRGFAQDAPKGSEAHVPKRLASLPPGIHESVEEEVEGMHIGVFDTRRGRVFFEVDLTGIEELEVHLLWLLLAIIVGGTLVGAWLGWLVARAAARPISQLAEQVESLPLKPAETAFAQSLPADELGRLGGSVDDYQKRLVVASRAEQAFFADASHELRTPIAVVSGALELLREDVEAVPGAGSRLDRVERGVTELSELVEALLRLARRQVGPVEDVDAARWLREVMRDALRRHAPDVRASVQETSATLRLSSRAANLVLRAVLRHLIPPGNQGTLVATASSGEITLHFSADAAPRAATGRSTGPSRGDLSLGVSLISKLSLAQGMRVDESRWDEGLVRLVLEAPRATSEPDLSQ